LTSEQDASALANASAWLDQLAQWQGAPAQYWPRLAQTAALLLSAPAAAVGWRPAGQGGSWQALAVEPERAATLLAQVPEDLWLQARAEGVAIGSAPGAPDRLGLACLRIQEAREVCLVCLLPGSAHHLAREMASLSALAWLPRLFERDRQARQGERDATRLAQVLETVGRLLPAGDFDRAALILANDLAERFACESVAVCWRAGEGLKLRALSHTEKLDRRSELSALLEEAGQEALSQGLEIAWPGPSVQRAHERYAVLQQPGHLYTLPLSEPGVSGESDKPWGSITVERQKMAFTQAERWALRLYADMALQPLLHWHQRSRALPIRLGQEVAHSLPQALRPRTPMGRRLGWGIAASVALIGVIPWPYSVTAGATVKTDTMAFVGAPFDGYLESSAVQPGSQVRAGDPLFSVGTRELMLERANIQAEIAQASREAEKRRAVNQLPEMQMAESQVAQGQAKLAQIQQRVKAAAVVAPMDGVVIEGEPGKNLGGAVRRGDTVIKIAALSALYVEAAVSEKDLSRVAIGQDTRLTLLAEPALTHPLKVQRIIPQAAVVDGDNTFPVRLALDGQPGNWWRPGMTGIAKISIGWRPLAWIATHRLIDYLRITFWL
jgi:biotin carboxyl carrier protein